MKRNKGLSLLMLAALCALLAIGGCSGNDNGGNEAASPSPVETASPSPEPTPSEAPAENPAGEPEPDQVLLENEAFRLFAPAPDSEVGNSFTVRGEARVFEAAFSYALEDGHNILAEGHAMTDAGAPEWGAFEFEVRFEQATSPVGVLTLYVASANDGSPEHALMIPLTFEESLVKSPDTLTE